MKKVEIASLQTWFDISIQHTGNVCNAFAIAKFNNQSITDLLTAGDIITIPDELPLSNKAIQYFKNRGIIPAGDYK